MPVFEWAGLLCVPVGGGPPAHRPRRELRSARPPSTAHDLPSSVWSLCVPVGGGPPARSPHASLTARSGRFRGPPWPCRHPPAPQPGPATAHGHRSLAHPTSEPSHAKPLLGPRPSHPAPTSHIPEPTRNFACNSPNTISNLELRSLELQRFQTLSKLHPIELHATFLEGRH